MTVVYDAGALIAIDRGDRAMLASHSERLRRGVRPAVTAPVLARVRRSSKQVQLNRAIAGCELVGFDPDDAAPVGALLAAAGTSDVVDAHVVITAARINRPILTGDVADITALIAAFDRRPPRLRVEPLGP